MPVKLPPLVKVKHLKHSMINLHPLWKVTMVVQRSKNLTMEKILPRSVTCRDKSTRYPLQSTADCVECNTIPLLPFCRAGCIFKSYHARSISHHAICYLSARGCDPSVGLNKINNSHRNDAGYFNSPHESTICVSKFHLTLFIIYENFNSKHVNVKG